DGIRDYKVTGVQTCALPILDINCLLKGDLDLISKAFGNAGLLISFCQQDVESIEYLGKVFAFGALDFTPLLVKQVLPDGFDKAEIGRASCREGGESRVGVSA